MHLSKKTRGALAGVGATVVMSATMWAAQRAGLLGEAPPKKITRRAAHAAGFHPSETTLRVLSVANHLGFGMSLGTLFSSIQKQAPLSSHPVLQGVLFGTGVWAASYAGWVPAMKIMPPPSQDRPGRPESMLVSHWIFGAALGALHARLGRTGWAGRHPGE